MKKLLLLMLAVTLAFSTFAVPAYPGLITVNQSDGSTISYYLRGDEHFSYTMTEDGYLITANADGIYEYARIEDGKTIVPTGMKVHNVLDRSVNEQNFVNGLAKAESLTSELNVMRAENVQKAQNRKPAAEGGPRRFPLQGSPKGLIILVSYSDLAFKTDQSYFQNMANQTDFSENYGTGSIRDYFIEASDSQFTPIFDVYGPYTLPQTKAYYGGQTSTQHDANARQMVIDACDAAAAAGVDFTQYDNDNDGCVDNIFVYFAGHNQAEGGGNDCIWPHRSAVNTSKTYSGKSIYDYACTSEYRGSSGSTKCGIGTFCHEFSHVLGLPDFYDTDYSKGCSAMGSWDIMTNGNYNNNGHTPPTYTAYERFYIGWLTPTALTNDSTVSCEGTYSLKSLISSNTAYLVSATQHNLSGSGPNPKEFFMLEYRKMEGRDTYTGLSEGLLVTHINYKASTWSGNNPNNDKTCLGYYPVLPGKTGETHIASSGSSAVYPYGDYDYCKFVLHGQEDAMARMVKNISNEDSCVTFDYVTPNEKIVLKVHDIEAFLQDTVTQFVVKGSDIHEDLQVYVTNNQEFTLRIHTADDSGEYSNKLTISPDSLTGVIVDTIIDVKYTPKRVTYDTYSETKFNVKGTETSTLTQVEKFRYRNRRPVYVTAPVAYDAQDIQANSALLTWSFVADTTAGIADIEKYGAKYYVDVYNESDEPQTETEGFENFPTSIIDGWSANFETYTDQYRKAGQRAAKYTSDEDTIYTKTYVSDITSVSFWLQSINSAGVFQAEVQNAATGAWQLLGKTTIDKEFKKDLSYNLPTAGYNRLRLFYMPTEGELAIDEVSVTTGKSITYAAKNQYVRDTTYTVTGLELGKTYKFTVRATDKDEKVSTPRYENITEVSNVVEFTTKNGGGGGGQSSDSTKLVAIYDASTGGYWVSVPEVKTYVQDGKTKNYVLCVYDLAGMMVYRTVVTESTVFIPYMPGGLYTVKYSEENKSKKTDPMTKIVFRGVGMKK